MSVTRTNDVVLLEGAVTMETVPALLAELRSLCDANVRTLDFAGATEVDSAAVALALEVRRMRAADSGSLAFRNLPDALRKLIALYGVEEHLGA